MKENDSKTLKREMPHSHLLHALLPISFIIIQILDSSIFQISIWLNQFVPFFLRIILCIITLVLAIILVYLAHKALFHENGPSDTLITRGILNRVRNPMYSGISLIYVAFILLSISIISIILFIIIFFIYNKMVNYEENILEDLFGNEYVEYKEKVPKWIPRIFLKK